MEGRLAGVCVHIPGMWCPLSGWGPAWLPVQGNHVSYNELAHAAREAEMPQIRCQRAGGPGLPKFQSEPESKGRALTSRPEDSQAGRILSCSACAPLRLPGVRSGPPTLGGPSVPLSPPSQVLTHRHTQNEAAPTSGCPRPVQLPSPVFNLCPGGCLLQQVPS